MARFHFTFDQKQEKEEEGEEMIEVSKEDYWKKCEVLKCSHRDSEELDLAPSWDGDNSMYGCKIKGKHTIEIDDEGYLKKCPLKKWNEYTLIIEILNLGKNLEDKIKELLLRNTNLGWDSNKRFEIFNNFENIEKALKDIQKEVEKKE